MAEYHTIYKNRKVETTEWDDIQRRLGNLPELPKQAEPSPYTPEPDVVRNKDWLETKSTQELEDLEDDSEVQDDRFLEEYRAKRLAEMKADAIGPKFGNVLSIGSADWVREVTNAGKGQFVIAHLYKDGNAGCQVLAKALDQVAEKYPGTKFVKIVSTECIPNYPDTNLPTLLVYRDTDVHKQFVGLGPFAGYNTTPEDVAFVLHQVGCLGVANPGEERKNDAVSERVKREYLENLLERMSRAAVDEDDTDSDIDSD